MTPRLVLTTGEPAGVGPDILLNVATQEHRAQLIAVGSKTVLAERASALGLDITFMPYTSSDPITPHLPGTLPLIDIPISGAVAAGTLDTRNAGHVLAVLDQALSLCTAGECHGMVTAPIHKGVINEAGIPFFGHTEYLASATATDHVVMLLTNDVLRVALATTHLPLSRVPAAITAERLSSTICVLEKDLRQSFGIAQPRITVLGLNPHAGEDGHLGREEIEVIKPVCDSMRSKGFNIAGPISADTAFSAQQRSETDVYLAMFHDQGLPVIKSEGFTKSVNVTLGLPIKRLSVDHGTALSLAGTGLADSGSITAAIELATRMAMSGAAGGSPSQSQ